MVAGLLIGGFYAAVSLGVSLIFGLLDIANIAQPAFLILGSYAAYVLNSAYGLDPILTGLLLTPLFYLLGAAVYRVYYSAFERRGEESLRGLVFFFGMKPNSWSYQPVPRRSACSSPSTTTLPFSSQRGMK